MDLSLLNELETPWVNDQVKIINSSVKRLEINGNNKESDGFYKNKRFENWLKWMKLRLNYSNKEENKWECKFEWNCSRINKRMRSQSKCINSRVNEALASDHDNKNGEDADDDWMDIMSYEID